MLLEVTTLQLLTEKLLLTVRYDIMMTHVIIIVEIYYSWTEEGIQDIQYIILEVIKLESLASLIRSWLTESKCKSRSCYSLVFSKIINIFTYSHESDFFNQG